MLLFVVVCLCCFLFSTILWLIKRRIYYCCHKGPLQSMQSDDNDDGDNIDEYCWSHEVIDSRKIVRSHKSIVSFITITEDLYCTYRNLRLPVHTINASVLASCARKQILTAMEQAVGQAARIPLQISMQGARIGLCPPTFQWLHFLWSDWNSVKTDESVCWSVYSAQAYSFQTQYGHSMHGFNWGGGDAACAMMCPQ